MEYNYTAKTERGRERVEYNYTVKTRGREKVEYNYTAKTERERERGVRKGIVAILTESGEISLGSFPETAYYDKQDYEPN